MGVYVKKMNENDKPIATVTINLVLAGYFDLTDDNHLPRYGTMYFLKSQVSGKIDNRPYYLTHQTDKRELNTYFKEKMVYVPRGPFAVVDTTKSEEYSK